MQGANTQTGRGFGAPTLNQPEWAWRPVQEDFGQVDVRRGQYDTGMVPTVNVQMPFSALANRQQAVAQRKAALAQKVANFDRYAGLGSAPDPYLQNFGKLARGGMDQFVRDIADSMYGGDMNAATRGIMESPELMARFKTRAASFNEIGQQAQGWFDNAMSVVEAAEADPGSVNPETLRIARETVTGVGEFGGANGPDPEALARKGQLLETRLSMDKAFKDFVVPGLEKAMVTLQGQANIKRGIGGKIIVETTKTTDFENLKEQMAREWARSGIADSYQQAREYLDGRLGFSQITDTSMQGETFTPEREAAAKAKYAEGGLISPSISVVSKGDAQKTLPMERGFDPKTGKPRPSMSVTKGAAPSDVLMLTPQVRGTGGMTKVLPREVVNDDKGNPQVLIEPRIFFDNNSGKFKVEGRVLGERTTREYQDIDNEIQKLEGQVEQGVPGAKDKLDGYRDKRTEIESKLDIARYDASQNTSAVERMTSGYKTPEAYYASQLGVTEDVFMESMKDPAMRKEIIQYFSSKQ